MLKNLTLTNFRKHQDLTIDFSSGLNTIKGSNEQGKTTLTEAILYAWFGARALRESLAQVVTYDKPENSLKVILTWEQDGVEYVITRSKAGAELVYGGDGIVTGQSETRSFIERLLGCSASTARLLMFADQNSVRGILHEGDAGNLVEQLADLQLIDTYISKVGDQLPCGNTKALEAQLAISRERKMEPPVKPSDAEKQAALRDLNRASAHFEKLNVHKPTATAKKIAAEAELARAAEARIALRIVQKREKELQEQMRWPEPCRVTPEMLEEAQRLVEQENLLERKRKSKAKVFPVCSYSWEGSSEELDASIGNVNQQIKEVSARVRQLELETVQVKAQLITEQFCPLCKKDLSSVPEVTVQNKAVHDKLAQLQEALDQSKRELKNLKSEELQLADVWKTTRMVEALRDEFWEFDYTTLPPSPKWIGGELPPEGELPDVAAMRRERAAYEREIAKAEAAKQELSTLCFLEVPCTEEAQQSLKEAEKTLREIEDAAESLKSLMTAKVQADNTYAIKMEGYMREMELYQQTLQAISDLEHSIKLMEVHNDLIKDLRKAKPVVRDKVWNLILGSVSHYFSQIRGVESVVTREGAEFRVNGRPVEGLSGSTLDSLGLAIRVALSKTFLPGVPFLVLDEPFAGCDERRETSGLGTIAGAGFEQVLLITHSDLADSLSSKLIEL